MGRSAALNSPRTNRAIAVEGRVTESNREKLAACFDHVIAMRPEHYRLGWQAKNVMVQYSPFHRTLFLDADCLVMRDLTPLFEMMRGKPVCFSAKPVPEQETGQSLFANVRLDTLLSYFRVDWWPQILGGGHFYFEQTATAVKVFDRARWWARLERLIPFGWEQANISDELTLQCALVEAGLETECAIRNLPLAMWCPNVSGRPDVLKGVVSCRRPDGSRYSTEDHSVVHFGGDHDNVYYRRERYRLAFQAVRSGNRVALTIRSAINRPDIVGLIAYSTLRTERLKQKLARAFHRPADTSETIGSQHSAVEC